MKQLSVFTLTIAMLFSTGRVSATTWKQDQAHSQVKFSVTHLVISEVEGTFKDFDVTLTQNGAEFAGSTLEASIKTASVTTENEMRDKHLKSDDFFNAEKYPTMLFKSNAFEKTGENTYRITGTLTIRDVTKPIVLEAKFLGQVTDPWGNQKAGFKATGSINRFDYGIKWNKAVEAGGLVVSDKVDITLLMELQKQK
jgi:polyisoprenoid-binding protein YceI